MTTVEKTKELLGTRNSADISTELPISTELTGGLGHFLALKLQTTTADTKNVNSVEDTLASLENGVSYETSTNKIQLVQSEFAASTAACDETDNEDAMFSALEDRIDDFLEQEGVFVSHVDDAKAALFDPFVTRPNFSLNLPANRSSINLTK